MAAENRHRDFTFMLQVGRVENTETTMRRLTVLLALVLATPAHAQDATGVWKTEPGDQGYLEVQIAACGTALCGTILRARSNAGEEFPGYQHVGKLMLRDMKADGSGKWSGGKIWDPRNDKTYNSKMVLKGDALDVSGCVLGLCQSQQWTRLQ